MLRSLRRRSLPLQEVHFLPTHTPKRQHREDRAPAQETLQTAVALRPAFLRGGVPRHRAPRGGALRRPRTAPLARTYRSLVESALVPLPSDRAENRASAETA